MNRPAEQSAEQGFTLVETVVTMVLAVMMLYGLHATLNTSIRGRQSAQELATAHGHAMDFLSRLRGITFGQATDPAPGSNLLDELFDDNQTFGTITLHQLVVQPTAQGHTFAMANGGVVGTWRVKVSRDLNRNGVIDGLREGRDDLLGIEIYFNGRLMASSMRAADPDFTTKD